MTLPLTNVIAGHENVVVQHQDSPVHELQVRLEAVVHAVLLLIPEPYGDLQCQYTYRHRRSYPARKRETTLAVSSNCTWAGIEGQSKLVFIVVLEQNIMDIYLPTNHPTWLT
jgi:hypothetical protein